MDWNAFMTSKLVNDLGLALLDSLWQIALVALFLRLALAVVKAFPAVRHNLCLAALLFCVALPAVTFVRLRSAETGSLSNSTVYLQDQDIDAIENAAARDDINADGTTDASHVQDSGSVSSVDAIRDYFATSLANIRPFAVGVWLLGIFGFSIRLAGGLFQLRRYRTKGLTEVDRSWETALSVLSKKLNLSVKVSIAVSSLTSTPISIGYFKPLILLPAAALLHISPLDLQLVIAHELVHLRRLDPLVSVIQSIIETILFFHPAVWWISGRLRKEREFATDRAVLELFNASETAYARVLANLEELRLTDSNERPRIAPAANGGNLMERIKRILNGKTEERKPSSAWTALLVLALTSAFALGALWFNPAEVVNAQNKGSGKKLAIGFVSIPPLDRTANAPLDADATTRLLIDAMKRHKVPALGFLQGGMISDGEKLYPVRAATARLWRDAGLEIGLGGFKHIWLYHTPVDEYIANIEKNERVAKDLIGDMGLPPRYFSYPYMNTGKTEADRAKVEAWLAGRGYTSVKYTIDNNEWMYSYAYDMARNDNDVSTMREIRESYVEYMSKMIDHFEAYSLEMFGRDIAQTMVLTPSRLVTDTADDFFKMLKKKDYSFVSVDEAQSDPAYKTVENFNGNAGISWFERWALAKNQPRRAEPKVDPSVESIWNAKAAKK